MILPKKFPYTLVQNDDPVALIRENGCTGCHTIDGKWGYGGTTGPPLGGKQMLTRIQTMLNSDEYLRSLKEIELLDSEPYRSFKTARREVVQAQGEEKIRLWIKYRLQEPRFDRLYSQMPSFGLSETEAFIITDYLLPKQNATGLGSLKREVARLFRQRSIFFAFLSGFASALVLAVGIWLVKR